MTPGNAVFSTMVRAGKATYFIDVREAKNGNRYLSIAETRLEVRSGSGRRSGFSARASIRSARRSTRRSARHRGLTWPLT